jgi:thiol:disulfide interchange protein DsbC
MPLFPLTLGAARTLPAVVLGLVCMTQASANEALIRKNLSERLANLPTIEEIRPSAMPGLFEVRVQQAHIFYTDAEGNFLIQGTLFDTRARANLTEQRIEELSRLAFADLPLRDAITTVRGNGQRKIAVFMDPNCGFCKRLDRELVRVNHVTVYTFLVPMLGPNSQAMSRNIWCAANPAQAYSRWMLQGVTPAEANCDTAALERNLAFATRHRITGTPTTFMADGTRIVGADFNRIQQSLTGHR